MKQKFYVSLEAAKLLKEKGYNEMTDCSIDEDGNFWNEQRKNETMPEWKWSCPTKDEAIDWLESEGIVVEVPFVRNKKWRFSLYKGDCFYMDSWIHDRLDFPTRLEAEEAAIIKALELL